MRQRPDSCVHNGTLFASLHYYCMQAAVKCAIEHHWNLLREQAKADLEQLSAYLDTLPDADALSPSR